MLLREVFRAVQKKENQVTTHFKRLSRKTQFFNLSLRQKLIILEVDKIDKIDNNRDQEQCEYRFLSIDRYNR